MLGNKPLFQEIEEKFKNETVLPEIQERAKKLSEIKKARGGPVNYSQIKKEGDQLIQNVGLHDISLYILSYFLDHSLKMDFKLFD